MGMDKYKTGLAKKLGLDVPSSPPLKGKGTTGLMLPELKKSKDGRMILYPKLKSTWSPEFVMQYIANQANGYGEYIESVWDCEDYAFLAAADVRRRFPGQAIGILLGIGRYGGENINGKGHAINILWFSEREDDQMSWFPDTMMLLPSRKSLLSNSIHFYLLQFPLDALMTKKNIEISNLYYPQL